MNLNSGSWKQYLARVAVLCGGITLAVFAGNRLANAGPGEPVRKSLTVAGTLTGVSGGTTTAAFRFYRAMGDATPLCAPEVTIRDGFERNVATGTFSVEVPLTQSGHECPDTLFHDPSAFVEVAVGSSMVAPRGPVNPVPYAVYAQQYGTPDCPVGYRLVDNPAFSVAANMRLCAKSSTGGTDDEAVRVGIGASAFWIDRYEASVWGATGTRFGSTGADYATGSLPANGQWRVPGVVVSPLHAESRAGVTPSRFITWFQAMEVCAASGKRLPTGEEWLRAAQGTADPGSNAGEGGRCVTFNTVPRLTGGALGEAGSPGCKSAWGAEDMIGNLREWTGEWYVGVGDTTSSASSAWSRFPEEGFSEDTTENISSSAYGGLGSTVVQGLPSAAIRGGGWSDRTNAGLLHMYLRRAPSGGAGDTGFRCVIPR